MKEEDYMSYMRLKEAEERVKQYILELTDNNIGYGETPIDFLIASHRMLLHNMEVYRNIKK